MDPRTTEELLAGLDNVRSSPAEGGVLELIVRRPAVDEREVLDTAELRTDEGLAGDGWRARGSRHTPDGSPEIPRQLTMMNVRAIDLFAGDRSRWPLAGDQLYVDFDLSEGNLPTGAQLRVGDAIVEVSVEPHTGCAKFASRFGKDALRFMNSAEGKLLRLRGINARVVRPGTISTGDTVAKLAPPA